MHNTARHQCRLGGGSEPTSISHLSVRDDTVAQQSIRSTRSTPALHQSRKARLDSGKITGAQPLGSQLMSSGVPLKSEHRRLSDNISQHRPLGEILHTLDRRYCRFADITYKTSSQRTEVCHRLDNLQYSLARLQNSIGGLMKKVAVAKPKTNNKKPRNDLKELESSVFLDMEELQSRIETINALTSEMRSTEREVEKAERSFHNAHQAAFTAFRRHKLIDVDAIGSDITLVLTPSRASTASSAVAKDTVDELEVYYEAVSDLRNMRERIWDLQAEQQEQWERRGLLEDQGHVLQQSDDEFVFAWQKPFEIANHDFERARTAVEDARRACVQANIAIPLWAEVNSVEDHLHTEERHSPIQGTVSPLNSGPTHRLDNLTAQIAEAVGAPLLHDRGSPLSTPPVYNSSINDRVAQWVKQIDTQPKSNNKTSPIETPKSSDDLDQTLLRRINDRKPISTASLDRVTSSTKRTVSAGNAVPSAKSLDGVQNLDIDHLVWYKPLPESDFPP